MAQTVGESPAHGPNSDNRPPWPISREETRLKKRVAQLQKKIHHLESQLVKSRAAERGSKRDLIQRKGDLAESRMLVERLQTQLSAARQNSADGGQAAAAEDGLAKLDEAIRRLASEQKKTGRRLNELACPPAPPFLATLGSIAREG